MKTPTEPDLPTADADTADVGDATEAPQVGAPPVEEAAHPRPEGTTPLRTALTAVGLLALLASAILGSDLFGIRGRVFGSARPEPRPPAVSRRADAPTAPTAEAPKTVLRSQPWWQGVATVEGDGPMATPEFGIVEGAVQWRAKWTCESGRLLVTAPGRSKPVVDANCPGSGTGYATSTGSVSLDVGAEGHWKLQVDQQVDVPLNEPPLPAMTEPGAVKVSSGSFFRVDQTGMGTATLYRLADGAYALRLDDFFVTANSELEVKLSTLEEPKTSSEFIDAPSALVAPLEVTTGSLNFSVPSDVDPTHYKSVVIWCRLIASAYSAATLRPVG